MQAFSRFVRREAVLCAAFAAALCSMLFVPPDARYAGYIDVRVLALLWCLMLIVAGLLGCGVFEALAQKLLSGKKSVRSICLALTLAPFFCSMLITNDVALLTFVPFALLVLESAGLDRLVVPVVVLQTVAANLGSMATPVGNPQNLYLYARFSLQPGGFLRVVLPLTLASLAACVLLCLRLRGPSVSMRFERPAALDTGLRLRLLCALFAVCLLCVFRVVHYAFAFALTLAYALAFDRPLLKKADYALLLTFVCFFVFSGNIGRCAPLRTLLSGLMQKSALLTSLGASQIISNVPAALLLSGFTENWRGLLAGVNIGGLGTPVASLASLISLKLYARSKGARTGRFLRVFTLYNAGFLVLLLLVQALCTALAR